MLLTYFVLVAILLAINYEANPNSNEENIAE